jgi:hypothetical protein
LAGDVGGGFEELFFVEADLAGDDCAHGGPFEERR